MKIFQQGTSTQPRCVQKVLMLDQNNFILIISAIGHFQSRLGLRESAFGSSSSTTLTKSSHSRLLSFVVTAIAKLATYHPDLLPRARVSLAKVKFFS